jgi:hypothetical protein
MDSGHGLMEIIQKLGVIEGQQVCSKYTSGAPGKAIVMVRRLNMMSF